MENYRIKIVEYASRIVGVEAKDKDEAIELVKSMYFNEDVVLDYDDFDDVEFEVYND